LISPAARVKFKLLKSSVVVILKGVRFCPSDFANSAGKHIKIHSKSDGRDLRLALAHKGEIGIFRASALVTSLSPTTGRVAKRLLI
jgi:hypothetical protein